MKDKLNIRDNQLLKVAEEEITLIKQMELLKNPIKGNFSKAHFMNIHKFIFDDIYPFAGKIRREQISKADTIYTLDFSEVNYIREVHQIIKDSLDFPIITA